MTDVRYQPQYFAPPPPDVSPPAYDQIHHTKWPIYMAAGATVLSSMAYVTYLYNAAKENIKYIEKPVYVNKTIEVEKLVFVDKPFVVEKTIYIDNIVEHDCQFVAPMAPSDPYDGL